MITYYDQGVPSNIEQLEEVIQDHREFLLDLDSHKSMAMSINVIGSHLAEHSPTQTKAEGMRQRLALVNEKWDNVCEQATLWQTRLQTALLEVSPNAQSEARIMASTNRRPANIMSPNNQAIPA